MTSDTELSNPYMIDALWGPREETPEQIAERFRRFIDGSVEIDPRLALWRVGTRRPRAYELVRDKLGPMFSRDVARDDFDRPYREEGFEIWGMTRPIGEDSFSIGGIAGASIDYYPHWNRFEIKTGRTNDPFCLARITSTLVRQLLFKVLDAWDPYSCVAVPAGLRPKLAERMIFEPTWMTYIHPELVGTVDAADIPSVEPLPNGGLLLCATTERFQTGNPEHFAAALRIGAAVRHLNTGRWSPDARQPPWDQYGPPL